MRNNIDKIKESALNEAIEHRPFDKPKGCIWWYILAVILAVVLIFLFYRVK